jgi:hypothetical protein
MLTRMPQATRPERGDTTPRCVGLQLAFGSDYGQRRTDRRTGRQRSEIDGAC